MSRSCKRVKSIPAVVARTASTILNTLFRFNLIEYIKRILLTSTSVAILATSLLRMKEVENAVK